MCLSNLRAFFQFFLSSFIFFSLCLILLRGRRQIVIEIFFLTRLLVYCRHSGTSKHFLPARPTVRRKSVFRHLPVAHAHTHTHISHMRITSYAIFISIPISISFESGRERERAGESKCTEICVKLAASSQSTSLLAASGVAFAAAAAAALSQQLQLSLSLSLSLFPSPSACCFRPCIVSLFNQFVLCKFYRAKVVVAACFVAAAADAHK